MQLDDDFEKTILFKYHSFLRREEQKESRLPKLGK